MINQNGWRMTTEWGAGNEYDATFQHWAAAPYLRWFRHEGREFSGHALPAQPPEGQLGRRLPVVRPGRERPAARRLQHEGLRRLAGSNDYAAYIRNLYTHDVSTKFIQHFKVVRWVNSPLDATSVKDASVNNGNEQITLKDDHGNVVVLSRGSNDTNNTAYRNRTITLNGITVRPARSPRATAHRKGTSSPHLLPVAVGREHRQARQVLR